MTQLFNSLYRGKTVLVTGHTGFKGGWLVTWLKMLGARVVGYALPPLNDQPNLFHAARVGDDTVSIMGDIRDPAALLDVFETYKPDAVFHLAAQSLVRRSYDEPLETGTTNILGTLHVLEAIRRTSSVRAAVVVTSDKCYENREWIYAYRENDSLGGHDVYSASKAAAEILTASYRMAFFSAGRAGDHHTGLASARAGNVMGGGDWSDGRLLPDCIRALNAGQSIPVRNPLSIRPWQHVLEPISGYLWLGVRLWEDRGRYADAWNFGPRAGENIVVRDIVEQIAAEWGEGTWMEVASDNRHEAGTLKLDCTKTADLLDWRPAWSLRSAIEATVEWYRRFYTDPQFDGAAFTAGQIAGYVEAARGLGLSWAQAESPVPHDSPVR